MFSYEENLGLLINYYSSTTNSVSHNCGGVVN